MRSKEEQLIMAAKFHHLVLSQVVENKMTYAEIMASLFAAVEDVTESAVKTRLISKENAIKALKEAVKELEPKILKVKEDNEKGC